ncbi:MAG: RluA family pseudouridine synthase, partial [Burkholderiales bacterium]|nr:RluA family pseudouridine synthase [Burkholderiales bacterium]
MLPASKPSVTWLDVDEHGDGQRIDNFLLRMLKGVPKSHVYRILRSGEVRVNGGRADPTRRLAPGDRLRIPPLRPADAATAPGPARALDLMRHVLFEDAALLALAKPAGIAVHGGSGVVSGVIESLRLERPDLRFLELVHRLDRDTSGVLLLAKKRSALTGMHAQIRDGQVDKRYAAMAQGVWRSARESVRAPLERHVLANGDRRVTVSPGGQDARTDFRRVETADGLTLVEARLHTGRTHQIRVHLAHLGTPIVGDDKYGDFDANREWAKRGLKRMFLHAARMAFVHPVSGAASVIEAPLPADL